MPHSITPLNLPFVIAGPILRHCEAGQIKLWLITSQAVEFSIVFEQQGQTINACISPFSLAIGERAVIHNLSVTLEQTLALDQLVHYDLTLRLADGSMISCANELNHLCLDGQHLPSFYLASNTHTLLHGSCRKPHFNGQDTLDQVLACLNQHSQDTSQRPSLLILSGDQVYCDDVAGPMLNAIKQTIALLGLFDEVFEDAAIQTAQELLDHPHSFYQRERLLPYCAAQPNALQLLFQRLFPSKSPQQNVIFSSANADNHLISLAEVLAMYCLVWSPNLWEHIELEGNAEQKLEPALQQRYQKETAHIRAFVSQLADVQTALANIPVYMMFDDHDITDDWNLTRQWEEQAYQHRFARRIIGNSLIAYWLNQGFGNTFKPFPKHWAPLLSSQQQTWEIAKQKQLIDELLEFSDWHYSINHACDMSPTIEVLDTRTQRWRSESNAAKPSGLMDWESLIELQQRIINQTSVIIVSPTPVFGVKFIEVIQRIFTILGKPLLVDAENWMAHPGAANVLLNMLTHIKAPQNITILSGDVHYSFAYDVSIKRKKHLPQSLNPQALADREIWQITASGIKNEFPPRLIRAFDQLDRKLYGSYSPLNWLTKRRRLRIKARKPTQDSSERLVNRSGIGILKLNAIGEPVSIAVQHSDGSQSVFIAQ